MIITENDVGRKVRLRNGKEFFVVKFYSGMSYPVILSDGSCYAGDGFYNDGNNLTKIDIVEFVDEEPTTSHERFRQQLQDLIPESLEEFEDNGQFIQKVPSAESNAKRFLNMLKAQGIYELVVVTDLGELRCKLNVEKQGEG